MFRYCVVNENTELSLAEILSRDHSRNTDVHLCVSIVFCELIRYDPVCRVLSQPWSQSLRQPASGGLSRRIYVFVCRSIKTVIDILNTGVYRQQQQQHLMVLYPGQPR